jgi:hypothetical protein
VGAVSGEESHPASVPSPRSAFAQTARCVEGLFAGAQQVGAD